MAKSGLAAKARAISLCASVFNLLAGGVYSPANIDLEE